jgi:protein TonB
MFDSVVRQNQLPRTRFGVGFLFAVLAHATIVVLAYWRTTHRVQAEQGSVEVAFVRQPTAPPPPPPPPPAAHRKVTPRVKPKPRLVIQQQPLIAPTQVPEEKPPEPSSDLPDEDEGEEGGVEGGVVGGVQGGVVGGVVGSTGPPANVRVEYNDTMPKMVKLSGPDPVYTRQAEEREIEGLMLVKCVVTIEGSVKDCRVLRGLPFLDRAVVDALERRRYRPVLIGGKPVEVDYTFHIRMGLPR